MLPRRFPYNYLLLGSYIEGFRNTDPLSSLGKLMNTTVIHCISCNQKLRLPSDRKALEVKCPSCSKTWKWLNPDFQNIENKTSAAAVNYGGISAGVIGSAMNFADNVIFNAKRGHGFAGERVNHLHDLFTGKDATLVGGDNVKNGADRLVDGIYIQTKYCKTGSKCVSEAFDKNGSHI